MTEIQTHVATAYDLFLSLMVLHEPERYGLRPAWAAGIRARVPEPERTLLEKLMPFFFPLHWVATLPAPADAATALTALAALPPENRFEALACVQEEAPCALLRRIARRGAWDEDDLAAFTALTENEKAAQTRLVDILDLWSQPAESGRLLLGALQCYYDSFFAEEERRIRSWLEKAAAEAEQLAQEMSVPDLLEHLSDGLLVGDLPPLRSLVLIPAFWNTPFVVHDYTAADRLLFLYGARPLHVSLAPGALVPDDLIRGLKALADPTRLRILRILQQEPQTTAELARRLRLRAPTVVHHLHILRLARLVHLTLETEGRRLYGPRSGALDTLHETLRDFLSAE
jgi:DNA-binding transcriptional ArsR family regulator